MICESWLPSATTIRASGGTTVANESTHTRSTAVPFIVVSPALRTTSTSARAATSRISGVMPVLQCRSEITSSVTRRSASGATGTVGDGLPEGSPPAGAAAPGDADGSSAPVPGVTGSTRARPATSPDCRTASRISHAFHADTRSTRAAS